MLEEDEGDVLVNVNIQDDEKAKENIENRLKKPTYKPYEEDEIDEFGMVCCFLSKFLFIPCQQKLKRDIGIVSICLSKIITYSHSQYLTNPYQIFTG